MRTVMTELGWLCKMIPLQMFPVNSDQLCIFYFFLFIQSWRKLGGAMKCTNEAIIFQTDPETNEWSISFPIHGAIYHPSFKTNQTKKLNYLFSYYFFIVWSSSEINRIQNKTYCRDVFFSGRSICNDISSSHSNMKNNVKHRVTTLENAAEPSCLHCLVHFHYRNESQIVKQPDRNNLKSHNGLP